MNPKTKTSDQGSREFSKRLRAKLIAPFEPVKKPSFGIKAETESVSQKETDSCAEESEALNLADKSGVVGVTWVEATKSWKAEWRKGLKRVKVFFPVETYGEEALRLAIESRRIKTKKTPRGGERKSAYVGVSWDKKQKAWVAQWQDGGKTKADRFPVSRYGEDEALRLAIESRKAVEERGKSFMRNGEWLYR